MERYIVGSSEDIKYHYGRCSDLLYTVIVYKEGKLVYFQGFNTLKSATIKVIDVPDSMKDFI